MLVGLPKREFHSAHHVSKMDTPSRTPSRERRTTQLREDKIRSRWGCCLGNLENWADEDLVESMSDSRHMTSSDTIGDESSSYGRKARRSVEVKSRIERSVRPRKKELSSEDETEEGAHEQLSTRQRKTKLVRHYHSARPRKKKNRISRDNVVEHVWQVFITNRWLTYEASIGQVLEELYRYISPEEAEFLVDKYKTNWWRDNSLGKMLVFDYKNYKICPLLMVQRNMNTGREFPIRRRDIEPDKVKIVKSLSPRRRARSAQHPRSVHYRRPLQSPRKNQRNIRSISLGRMKNMRSDSDALLKKRTSPTNGESFRSSGELLGGCDINYSDQETASEGADISFELFREWSNEQVIRWLRLLRLGKYKDCFKEKKVTGKDLSRAKLTWFIIELGLPIEQSIQIYSALKVLKSGFINVLGEARSFDSAGLFKSITSSEPAEYGVEREPLYPLYEQGEDASSGTEGGEESQESGAKPTENSTPAGLPPPFEFGRRISRRTVVTHKSQSRTGQLKQHNKHPTYFSHSGYPVFQTLDDNSSTSYLQYPEGDYTRDWLPMAEEIDSEEVSLAEEEESYRLYNVPEGNETQKSTGTTNEGRGTREVSDSYERRQMRGPHLEIAIATVKYSHNSSTEKQSPTTLRTPPADTYHNRRVSTRSQRKSAWLELIGHSSSPFNTCDENDESDSEGGDERQYSTFEAEKTYSRGYSSTNVHGRNRESVDNTSYTTIMRDNDNWQKQSTSESERGEVKAPISAHKKGSRRRRVSRKKLTAR